MILRFWRNMQRFEMFSGKVNCEGGINILWKTQWSGEAVVIIWIKESFFLNIVVFSFKIRKGTVHVFKTPESLKYFALLHYIFTSILLYCIIWLRQQFILCMTLCVSQICRKWNLSFRFTSMFYRIRLYVPQAFGKNDITLLY